MRRLLKRRNGFTLVETLAAFAILVLVMSNLLQGVGYGARNDSYAEFLTHARRDAEAHLAALGVVSPLAAGAASGRYDDGLLWNLEVEPYRAAPPPVAGQPAVRGYAVRLVVRRDAQASPSLAFATVKLAIVEEAQR